MRRNQWKLVIHNKNPVPKLYNLDDDTSESNDFAKNHSKFFSKMVKSIKKWKKI